MIVDLILAPVRWAADRVWFAVARRLVPLDDNLADIDA